jgi:hypothetical protein
MTDVRAYRKLADDKRAPGQDAFWYISRGHLCCPWCGESLCHDDASPKEGYYVTQDGEPVTAPPEPGDDDTVKAYHRACFQHKQTERQAAETAQPNRGGTW